MMLRKPGTLAALLLFAALPARAADKAYTAKVADHTPPPNQLAEPVRKLLDDRCVRFLDGKGEVLAELWFRKDIPAKESASAGAGLTYRDVPRTTLVGAMRVVKKLSDYKKQKVPAGVYTLRLEHQPMDGDHMGTAPYSEFLLVSKAAEDKDPGPMKPKALHDISGNVTEGHPGVFLLYPGKGATSDPKVVSKEGGAWVLLYQVGAAGGQKAVLPIGLTLVGASEAA
jgi:hypothetical protein